jgi:beta-lactamase regulating signal transducer with metallopeptidase domain
MSDLFDLVRRLGDDAGGTMAVLEILLRVTLLLTAAAFLILGLRRTSASLRHLVWTLSLVGTLLIPLFSWAFPAWRLAILPQPAEVFSGPVNEQAADSPDGRPTTMGLSTSEALDAPTGELQDLSAALSGAEVENSVVPGSALSVLPEQAWSWPVIVAIIWAAGTSLGLVWLGVGVAGAWYVTRHARLPADSPWRPILRQVLASCGFRRPVEVRECASVSIPMTWGVRRPVILVPAGSGAWSEATQRSVLLHELGHIRRGDCLMHLVGRLACVVYWFHPLVWLAARQSRKASEQAADDMVLSSRIAPSDYAEQLVGIAAQIRGLPWFGHAALPMASPSDLERRVVAILDPQRNHRSLKRKTCCALLILATLLLVPCAVLRLGYAEEKVAQNPDSTISGKDAKNVDEVSADALSPDRFPATVAAAIRSELQDRRLPFLNEDRLNAIQSDFRDFVRDKMPMGISAERRKAILESLRRHIPGDYLGMPDGLKTLKWKTWMAMRRWPLTEKEQSQLAAQRNWMRGIILQLPEDKYVKRQNKIEELAGVFADPLCTSLDRPMSEAQFAKFQEAIQTFLRKNRTVMPHDLLPRICHRFVIEALHGQWLGDKGAMLFPRFDTDPIIGCGTHNLVMNLSFQSNREHVGWYISLNGFSRDHSLFDTKRGPLRGPDVGIASSELSSWLEKEGCCDFGYDDTNGGRLFAVRGAKLLHLDVKAWYEADAIADPDLRNRIQTNGKDAIPLKDAYQEYKEQHTVIPPKEFVGRYIGVLTKEGRLAVVHVSDFSGIQSVNVGIRVRTNAPSTADKGTKVPYAVTKPEKANPAKDLEYTLRAALRIPDGKPVLDAPLAASSPQTLLPWQGNQPKTGTNVVQSSESGSLKEVQSFNAPEPWPPRIDPGKRMFDNLDFVQQRCTYTLRATVGSEAEIRVAAKVAPKMKRSPAQTPTPTVLQPSVSSDTATVRGRVLDHEGKPVKEARVFLRGPGTLEVLNGNIDWHMSDGNWGGGDLSVGDDDPRLRRWIGNVTREVVSTGADGRFQLRGLGRDFSHVIVLAPQLYVWAVPLPAEDARRDMTIRLPQPATLKVVMDIPGAIQSNEERPLHDSVKWPQTVPPEKDAWIHLRLMTKNMDGWKNLGNFSQTRPVANPGELVLANLTPGHYGFSRSKMLSLGHGGHGAFCDRQQDLVLSSGETKVIRLVRTRGQRVEGEVRGLPKDSPGAWIMVRSAKGEEPKRMIDQWQLSNADFLTCQKDAKFLTSLLEPGQYRIVAHAYQPEQEPKPRAQTIQSGVRRPDVVGSALVTIEDDDPAAPKKRRPVVTIEMKPRQEAADRDAIATPGTSRRESQERSPDAAAIAIAKGINWLNRHQAEDGRWSFDFTKQCKGEVCSGVGKRSAESEATGLALLPFLGTGQTHKEGKYRKTIAKGLDWLVKQQEADGNLAGKCDKPMRAHAVATFALCSAFDITKDADLEKSAQKAVDHIEHSQDKATGGWRGSPQEVSDIVAYGWRLVALESAERAGLKVAPAALKNAIESIPSVAKGERPGLDSKQPNEPATPDAIAITMLSRQYLGVGQGDPIMQELANRLMAGIRDPKQHNTPYDWFFGTSAMRTFGGPDWGTWNEKLRQSVTESQIKEGCAAGSWNAGESATDASVDKGDRLTTTCLSVLALEVYYRFLPINRPETKEGGETHIAPDKVRH